MMKKYEGIFEDMHEEILLPNGGIDFVRVGEVVERHHPRFNGDYEIGNVKRNLMVYAARKKNGEI